MCLLCCNPIQETDSPFICVLAKTSVIQMGFYMIGKIRGCLVFVTCILKGRSQISMYPWSFTVTCISRKGTFFVTMSYVMVNLRYGCWEFRCFRRRRYQRLKGLLRHIWPWWHDAGDKYWHLAVSFLKRSVSMYPWSFTSSNLNHIFRPLVMLPRCHGFGIWAAVTRCSLGLCGAWDVILGDGKKTKLGPNV